MFVPSVIRLFAVFPHGAHIQWIRSTLPMALALAVLAGMGLDLLIRSYPNRAVWRWCGGGFMAFLVILLMLWGFGRGRLPHEEASIRAASFVWPAVETAVGLIVVGALAAWHSRARRRGLEHAHFRHSPSRWAAAALLLCVTTSLVAVESPLWSSSSTFFAPTPGEVAIKRAVGSSLVSAGDSRLYVSLGIEPNANVVYNVRDFAVYEPMLPRPYFRSWKKASGVSVHPGRSSLAPSFFFRSPPSAWLGSTVSRSSSSPGGCPAPGAQCSSPRWAPKVRAERTSTAFPGRQSDHYPSDRQKTNPSSDTPGKAVAVTHPSPSSWKLVTRSDSRSLLRLRLTDVPGWHATVDGKALALHPFAGVMLQARLPAGTHTVELRYWPTTFSVGIILALCSMAGLIASLAFARYRSNIRHSRAPER